MSDRAVDADVVVAGAGAAGLAAALRCADAGLDVILAESRESYREGSNTAMSTAMVPAGGSRWQEREGIADSPQQFFDDVMAKTRGQAYVTVARALTGVAPELVEWLAGPCDVPLELVTEFHYPGHSADRCHTVEDRAGRTLHRHLSEARADRERITFAVPMRLTDVELSDSGSVRAAHLAPPGSEPDRVATRAVVLATNGYGANAELVARHAPEASTALYFGGDGSTGDALAIGERIGADRGFLDAYQGHASVAEPHGVLVTWATVMHGAVLLNAHGERFGNETSGYSEYAAPVLAQPGHVAWVVYDDRVHDACWRFRDYAVLEESGAIRDAPDEEALAELIGAPADRVAATLGSAAGAAKGAVSDPHGREDWEQPLSAPYRAVKVTGALFHTQGGLLVDADARVLAGREPVPGLYAAGGAAVGMSGHGAAGYLAGNGLLAALGLGYLAGGHLTDG
jgi:succinate dehydrogenase/fumarate reductase flavoprotein subunit